MDLWWNLWQGGQSVLKNSSTFLEPVEGGPVEGLDYQIHDGGLAGSGSSNPWWRFGGVWIIKSVMEVWWGLDHQIYDGGLAGSGLSNPWLRFGGVWIIKSMMEVWRGLDHQIHDGGLAGSESSNPWCCTQQAAHLRKLSSLSSTLSDTHVLVAVRVPHKHRASVLQKRMNRLSLIKRAPGNLLPSCQTKNNSSLFSLVKSSQGSSWSSVYLFIDVQERSKNHLWLCQNL